MSSVIEALPDVQDPLLDLTTEEWTQHKAKFVGR
jgi:hypothetical protein